MLRVLCFALIVATATVEMSVLLQWSWHADSLGVQQATTGMVADAHQLRRY